MWSSRVLIAVLVLAGASGGSGARAASERSGFAIYLALVEQYRAGDTAGAVEALSRWQIDELEAGLREWHEHLVLVEAKEDAPRGDRPSPLEMAATAMVAHLDAAQRLDGGNAIGEQLERARLIGDFAIQADLWSPDTEPGAGFLARWHLVAATIWLGSLQLSEAARHLDMARDLRPDDAAILLARGSLQETYAAAGAESPVPDHARGAAIMPEPATVHHLEEAVRLFESALIADSGLREARTRYARVLWLLGESEAAAREASRALIELQHPGLRYQTLLIAGAIDEARERFTEAADRYRAARDLCRGCQSATLALSHALARLGEEAAALEMVERTLYGSPPPDDPWWLYHRGQWHQVETMLTELRERVPR